MNRGLMGPRDSNAPIFCTLGRTSAATIGNAATTAMPWQVIQDASNRGNMWELTRSASKLLIPVTGRWSLTASVALSASATGQRLIYIRRDPHASGGVSLDVLTSMYVSANSADTTSLIAAVTRRLIAGDEVDVALFQNSGGDLTTPLGGGENYHPFFSAVFLGKA